MLDSVLLGTGLLFHLGTMLGTMFGLHLVGYRVGVTFRSHMLHLSMVGAPFRYRAVVTFNFRATFRYNVGASFRYTWLLLKFRSHALHLGLISGL